MLKILTAPAANAAPTSGPRIGTHAYRQPDSPFPAIGSNECASRGPRSRAGLIAYPVVPPSESPIPQTSAPTSIGPSPAATPAGATRFENSAVATSTRTKVPSTSLKKFHTGRYTAGAVAKHANFASAFSVNSQCGLYCSQTAVAPHRAPRICAGIYVASRIGLPVIITEASVNAGFRCPSRSPSAALTATPANTATPQPAVIEIHPAFCAFDRFKSAPATTPLPSTINTNVPTNSPTTGDRSTISLTLPRTHSPARQYGRPADPSPSTPHFVPAPSPAHRPPQAQPQSPLAHPETAPESAAPAHPQPSAPSHTAQPTPPHATGREAGDAAEHRVLDHPPTASAATADQPHRPAPPLPSPKSDPSTHAASTQASAKPPSANQRHPQPGRSCPAPSADRWSTSHPSPSPAPTSKPESYGPATASRSSHRPSSPVAAAPTTYSESPQPSACARSTSQCARAGSSSRSSSSEAPPRHDPPPHPWSPPRLPHATEWRTAPSHPLSSEPSAPLRPAATSAAERSGSPGSSPAANHAPPHPSPAPLPRTPRSHSPPP